METFTVDEIVADNTKAGIMSLAILNMIGDHYKEIVPFEGKKSIDIEVRFNGVEVSFREFIKLLDKCYSDNVNKSALEIVEEKLGKLNDTLYEIDRLARQKAKDILNLNE